MNNKRFAIAGLFLWLVFSARFLSAAPPKTDTPQKGDAKKLAASYHDWLELVSYIVTPAEKEVFMKLTSDRERDSFINLFWNLRDPSKGTPQNEFKDEHLKRFQYANQYFKYGSPLPGWKTDRGRIYIILGPPVNKEEIEENGLRPVEIWDYYGGPSVNLPTIFKIAFYKPSGSGDYKLYIPAVDGPYSLLVGPDVTGQVDPQDYSQIYSKIRDIEPAVADIALSLVPGETQMSSSPSLNDSLLIAKIYDLPKTTVNATYAKNFLKYKGLVDVNVSTNYVDVIGSTLVLKDPRLNLYFIHLAMVPERVSVEELTSDKLYFNYKLSVTLKKGEHFIFQGDKDFPVYFTRADVENTIAQGVIITDLLPVVPGEYKLTAVLRNSVTDEISYLEQPISVEDHDLTRPRLYEPILAYGIGPGGGNGYAPYRILGQNIKIDPKAAFGLNDSITAFYFIEKGSYEGDIRLKLEIESLDPARPFSKVDSFVLPQAGPFSFIPRTLEPLPYGDYVLRSRLLDKDETVWEVKEKKFQVALTSQVPHPAMISKILKDEDGYIFYAVAAMEFEEMKRYSEAENFYNKALKLNPSGADLIKKYAIFLLQQGKPDTLLEVIENLKNQEKEAFWYHSLKGRALYGKKEFRGAVESLLEANKIYDSDILVLNTLGLALIQIGEKEEAVKALTASLKLQADQKDIQSLLLQLRKK